MNNLPKATILKIAAAIAAAVILLIVGLWVYRSRMTEAERIAQAALDYNDEMTQLRIKKSELERQIETLQKAQDAELGNLGTAVVLCTEPDETAQKAIAQMDAYGYVGVLAVSDQSFPGDPGCMTVQEVNALTDRGWELCLSADRETDINALYDRTAEAGLAAPTALYLPDEAGTDAQLAAAAALGISTVVRHSSVQEASVQEDTTQNALWSVSAMGSYETYVKDRFLTAVQKSDCIVLTVGDRREREQYLRENFDAMLKVMQEQVSKATVEVGGLQRAQERRSCYIEQKSTGSESEEIAARQAELEAINVKIREITNRSEA